jgi:hypothetical protein
LLGDSHGDGCSAIRISERFLKKRLQTMSGCWEKYKYEEVMTDGVWEKMRDQEGDQKEDG